MNYNLDSQLTEEVKTKAKEEQIPTVSRLSKSYAYELSEESIAENTESKIFRKEILLPLSLMIITLIAGCYTGISTPELIMIGIGCVWYIISCYKVFREDEKN